MKDFIIRKVLSLRVICLQAIRYTRFIFLAIVAFILTGYLVTAYADNSDSTYDYNSFNDFQSQINSAMGQDPNLSHTSTNNYLSSNMFNVSGPIELSTTWSDSGGVLFTNKLNKLLNPNNAVAMEAALGTLQNRINLTFGHAFSPKNRFKITIERLAEKQTFDFDSGAIDEWVSQYASGVAFQHLIGKGFLNNFSLGGYYAKALNQSFDPVLYLADDGAYYINYRHIAGATSMGGNLSIGLQPWKTGIIKLTSYYDSVHYNSIYSNVSSSDSSELGFGVEWEQYISNTIKTTLSYSSRALYTTMSAGIQIMRNILHDTRALGLSVAVSHNKYNTTTDASRDNAVTIGLQYYFTPVKNAYSTPSFNFNSLASWVGEPAVRMETVLAAADQESIAAKLEWTVGLTYTAVGENSELLSWTSDAASNVPNASISYTLSVVPVNELQDPDFSYSEDVTGLSQKVITDLKSGTAYKAKLTVLELLTQQASSTEKEFITNSSEIIWDPAFTVSNETTSALTLTWKAPDRSISTDTINYIITLVSESNSSDTHAKALSDATTSGENVAIDFDNLIPGTTYTITIDATNQHNDVYTITHTDYTCNTDMNTGSLSTPSTDDSSTTTTSVKLQWLSPERYEIDTVAYTLTLVSDSDSSDTHTFSSITDSNDTKSGVTISFDTAEDGGDALVPNTTYNVTLSATSDHTTYTDVATTTQTNVDIFALSAPTVSESSTTDTSVQLEWISPERYNSDTVIYSLTLVNQSDSSDTHTYNDITSANDTAAGKTITFDTAQDGNDTLTPQSTYNITLSAASDHTNYSANTSGHASTSTGTLSWDDPSLNITLDTTLATMQWTAPVPTVPDDIISYKLSLKKSDGTVIFTDKSISPTNETYTITDLSVNTSYVLTLTASDDHDQPVSIGGDDSTGDFTTNQGTLSFDSPTLSSNSDGGNYNIDSTWTMPTLNPANNDQTMTYSYKVVATYYDPNPYDDIPDFDVTIESGNQSGLSISNVPVSKTSPDSYHLPIKGVRVSVTASVETAAGKTRPDYISNTQSTYKNYK